MMQNLLLERVLKFFNVFELSRISGLKSHQLACARIHAIVKHELNHLAHVDISSIRRTISSTASRSRLDASYDCPVSGFLQGAAFGHGHLDSRIVIKESRIGLTLLDHFASQLYQLFRRFFPYSQRHGRLLGLKLICRFKAQHGKVVCRIFAVRCLSAHHQCLPHRISRECCCVPVVSDFVNLTCLKVHALNHFQSFVPGYVLFVYYIFFVKRPHILVESSESACCSAHFDMEVNVNEPYHLQSLHECFRFVLRNYSAVGCNCKQFCLPLLVAALFSLSLRFICHAVCVGYQPLSLNDAGLPEVNHSLLLHGLRNHAVNVSLTFFNVSLHSHSKNLLVVACSLA